MAGPYQSIDTSKVVKGPATLWLGPVGTAMPADTVAIGTAWTTPWAAIGATDTGVQTAWNPNTQDTMIEEQALPVSVDLVSADFSVTVALAEDTLENIKYAFGVGSIVTTAASTGIIGKKTLTLASALNPLALGIEMVNSFGFWRRVSVPNVVSVGQVTTEIRRIAGKRMYPTTFRATCAPEQITFVDMTAAAL